MNMLSVILLAIALAMDAFSISITKGFTQKKIQKQEVMFVELQLDHLYQHMHHGLHLYYYFVLD